MAMLVRTFGVIIQGGVLVEGLGTVLVDFSQCVRKSLPVNLAFIKLQAYFGNSFSEWNTKFVILGNKFRFT